MATYNTRYSLVVTDPTTDLALTGLTKGERTGSVFSSGYGRMCSESFQNSFSSHGREPQRLWTRQNRALTAPSAARSSSGDELELLGLQGGGSLLRFRRLEGRLLTQGTRCLPSSYRPNRWDARHRGCPKYQRYPVYWSTTQIGDSVLFSFAAQGGIAALRDLIALPEDPEPKLPPRG